MKREIVWTPNGCAHGPPLPKSGGHYCVSCQPDGVKVIDAPVRGEIPAAFRDLPDAYDAPQACASPHAATIVFEGAVNETAHVQKAKRERAR